MANCIANEKRSVAGIASEENRFFIARRLPGGDMGGKWEFPGGKAEEGENDEQALVREYLEEFGVSIAIGSKLAEAEFEHKGNKYTLHAYRVYFNSKNFTLAEHSEWSWAGLEEIEKMDFADSDLKLLPALKMQFCGKS
ncbi:(deoxy)nucleoside triphosphate pyrophosphohydrolase [Leadbettera azotonutricia]|uniref:8-oxo-dGTP diphosphatase n=1 Tax=Leadbettera azotonutricia (strain ATCC BAA-888 / DSM 13862 / ZAS-9) TaxID=545695 RepID=F5YAY8_LEAAZ|nr:(deoxy)nucleoside triphosphate pyrophosphohydrolase [Leadbettera azotonutricia]AEF81279.1 CTP pyrophosphohydrolase [Leadbettera azotonutricia ZAS-9]